MTAVDIDTLTMNSLQPYCALHRVLVEGDTEQLNKLIEADNLHVKSVLNSLATYTTKTDHHPLMFELPLALGACSGNPDMLTAILNIIDDVTQQDRMGNNIVHCLVMLADKHPLMACDAYRNLMSHIDGPTKQRLMHAKNQQQHTPLSLSAELCVPEMMEHILNTDAVYKYDMDTFGPYKQVMYKFSSQEILVNLLRYLTNVSSRKLQRFTDTNILNIAPLTEFRKKLVHKYFWIFLLWAIYRIILVVGYIIYMRHYLANGAVPEMLYSVLLAVAMFISCLDGISQIWWSRMHLRQFFRKYFFGDRPYVLTSSTRYPLVFPGALLCFVIVVMDLLQLSCKDYKEVRHALYSVAEFVSVLSLQYLLIIFSKTSYILAVIEKMMSETLAFMVVGFLPYMAFGFVFSLLETPFACATSPALSNTTFNEQHVTASLYTTLMRLMNVKTPDDILFTESNVPALSMIVYVMAILMWPLVLLNLLIALYNAKMQEITTHRDVITAVQHINVMLFVHDSYYVPFSKLRQMICKTRTSPMKSKETICVMEEIVQMP